MSKPPSKAPTRGNPRDPRVVVNDRSCVIDLWKVRLLLDMLRLPYRFAIALPVRRDELLDLTQQEWGALVAQGLDIVDLDSSQVTDAVNLRALHTPLSAADCLSLALARTFSNSILLTGDVHLRIIC